MPCESWMAEPPVSGAERIAAAFEAARADGRAALMPYMMGGFPDPETSQAVADAYVQAGAISWSWAFPSPTPWPTAR